MSTRLTDMITLSVYVADVMRPKYADRPKLARTVIKLYSVAGRLALLDLAACNRELTDRDKRRLAKLESTAESLAAFLGCELKRQMDPCGPSVCLKLPGGQSNRPDGTWGIV